MQKIIIINILACFLIALLGINRKMGFWGYFFSSLLLSPVIGILLLLVSDPKPRAYEQTK
jgi:hypothetical protein